eukprot:CAMPEP_0177425804 /NCGR_PEP_ID=MMETSP0368-20130122/73207_1 /TAXON_ID=447022 ORGANISM="Scrippsiella hangoei-like, Strain SHHI-4" /NCGR_SAMPLE_ID=MMETSP0368 /ASSEMBLY_ACC=CAM_ASM_000363 /LENGTH=74 /DNA_ID=CAMNT_0018896133 /DNA_START=368 /DNA_END=592 /DNA_ORIENTATION=-
MTSAGLRSSRTGQSMRRSFIPLWICDTEVDWRFFRGQDLGLPKRNAAIGAGRSGGGSLTRAGPSRIAGHRRHGR